MISDSPLPADLVKLFRDDGAAGRTLSVPLPPGRTVMSSEEAFGRPVYWLSDRPAPAGIWAHLRREHGRSGLWPLLLGGDRYEPSRPWESGEMYPDDDADPGAHDPASLLANWWRVYTDDDDDDDALSSEERLAVTAPYGDCWPGLAPLPAGQREPEACAEKFADFLLREQPHMRLGLVAADCGADALVAAGWSGPANYTNDTSEIAAVLRSWEERFGARVVGAEGHATLLLSVAAAPSGIDEALAVAAEHFAFCPDNIWQGSEPYTLAAYAERLIGQHCWAFWWD
jgi:hypothetical protein